MARLIIDVLGLDRAIATAAAVTPALRRQSLEKVQRATEVTSNAIRAQMFGRRGSIPEHVLGVRTGRLKDSIGDPNEPEGFRRVIPTPDGWTSEAGTSVFYARTHEHGLGRFRPRPFFAPGIKAAYPAVKMIMSDILNAIHPFSIRRVG